MGVIEIVAAAGVVIGALTWWMGREARRGVDLD